jgi:hypothetical protein
MGYVGCSVFIQHNKKIGERNDDRGTEKNGRDPCIPPDQKDQNYQTGKYVPDSFRVAITDRLIMFQQNAITITGQLHYYFFCIQNSDLVILKIIPKTFA